jgi:hypothetical protein
LLADGQWAEAEPLITWALATMHELGDRAYLPTCLDKAAAIWLRREPPDVIGAARLLGAAARLRRHLNVHADRVDDMFVERVIEDQRSLDGWQRAFEEGEALDLDAAVRYAIGADDPFRYLPAPAGDDRPSVAI